MSEGLAGVSVVGTGSVYGKALPGRSLVGLALEAMMAAVVDAGLTRDDVDGLIVTPTGRFHSSRIGYALGEHLGIYSRPVSFHHDSGADGLGVSLQIARWALAERRCRYAVLVDGGKWSDVVGPRGSFQAWALDQDSDLQYVSTWGRAVNPDQDEVWGGAWLHRAAAIAQRHAHDHGTTVAQLAAVSVAARRHAGRNPDAVHRSPLTADDVLESPLISTPLTRLMCGLRNDGAAAFVVTTDERADALPTVPVRVRGNASALAGASFSRNTSDARERSLGRKAADEALAEAGIGRGDVAVAAWNDPYAIATILALEEYGFADRGCGGDYIGDGARISPGGELPVNTHGGWLSCTAAGASHACLVEVVRQLQGKAGDRQVADATFGLVGSTGRNMASHAVTILGRE